MPIFQRFTCLEYWTMVHFVQTYRANIEVLATACSPAEFQWFGGCRGLSTAVCIEHELK